MNKDIFVVIEHLQGQSADISYMMLGGARHLAQSSGGNVVAVLLGNNVQHLVKDLAASSVLYVAHPLLAEFTSDAYINTLSGLIKQHAPRAVLFGHTSIGMDVAGGLSVRLNLPLISSCRNFTANEGFVCMICGGKIMVEGDLPSITTLITFLPGGYKTDEGKSTQTPSVTTVSAVALVDSRVTLKHYIQPEAGEFDISKSHILVSVGRGIQNKDNIELAEDLAAALGGLVSASRPVVDQGWLPSSRLIGNLENR